MKSLTKFVILFLCFITPFSQCFSQDINWLSGTWNGTSIIPGSVYTTRFVRTLIISEVHGVKFSGRAVSEVRDNNGTRQEVAFTGFVENKQLNFERGKILFIKEPPVGRWWNCSSCNSSSEVIISKDSILLITITKGCGPYCDGESKYYRLLSEFDTVTQRKIVSLFGSPSLAKSFKPIILKDETRPLPDKNNRPITEPKSSPTNNDTASAELKRTNSIVATYQVTTPEIEISLFDNGEIDGDIVTVYHNKERIINHKVLGISPLVYKVIASSQNRKHEFTLVAENLGEIPPNTAFMRITAGGKNYELTAKTNLQENATIIIEYIGK